MELSQNELDNIELLLKSSNPDLGICLLAGLVQETPNLLNKHQNLHWLATNSIVKIHSCVQYGLGDYIEAITPRIIFPSRWRYYNMKKTVNRCILHKLNNLRYINIWSTFFTYFRDCKTKWGQLKSLERLYLSPKYISNLNSCVDWEALPDLKKVKIDTQLLWSDRNMYLPCSKKDSDSIWNRDICFPKVDTIHITDSRLINPRPASYYHQNNLNLPSFHSFLNLQRGTKRLLIKYYNLSHIPYAIRNMEELEELDLSNNRIREFGLGRDKNYKKLRKINLSKNKIQRIHENIKIASVLKHLDLSDNNLKKYTEIKALEKLYWLETLDLRNNPIARDKGIIEYLQYDLPNTIILH